MIDGGQRLQQDLLMLGPIPQLSAYQEGRAYLRHAPEMIEAYRRSLFDASHALILSHLVRRMPDRVRNGPFDQFVAALKKMYDLPPSWFVEHFMMQQEAFVVFHLDDMAQTCSVAARAYSRLLYIDSQNREWSTIDLADNPPDVALWLPKEHFN